MFRTRTEDGKRVVFGVLADYDLALSVMDQQEDQAINYDRPFTVRCSDIFGW